MAAARREADRAARGGRRAGRSRSRPSSGRRAAARPRGRRRLRRARAPGRPRARRAPTQWAARSCSRPPTSCSGSAASTSCCAARGAAVDARRARGDGAARGGDRRARSGASTTSSQRWCDGRARGADPAFVAAKRASATRWPPSRRALDAPWTPPATGTLLHEPPDPAAPQPAARPDDRRGDAQARRADRQDQPRAAQPPPAPPSRGARSSSATPSARCHKPAAGASGRRPCTRGAWKTLVDGGKQTDYKCVGCHVTGYGQVGGSSLGHTKRLENVQCETCHGPGSMHVAEKGLEEPPAVHRETPGQHLHRLPQRAPLRHVPVRGLPARHPRPRATARPRARSWATARPGTTARRASRRARARRRRRPPAAQDRRSERRLVKR